MIRTGLIFAITLAASCSSGLASVPDVPSPVYEVQSWLVHDNTYIVRAKTYFASTSTCLHVDLTQPLPEKPPQVVDELEICSLKPKGKDAVQILPAKAAERTPTTAGSASFNELTVSDNTLSFRFHYMLAREPAPYLYIDCGIDISRAEEKLNEPDCTEPKRSDWDFEQMPPQLIHMD